MSGAESWIPQMEPEFGEAERRAVDAYFVSGGWLTEYTKTREFANALASYAGARYAFLFPNGTLSLSAALLAVGVKPGDEVIVPALTMIATATAVSLIGATPVLVDVEPETLGMDIGRARAAMTSRTSALILVSLNGRTPDPGAFKELTTKHGVAFVEDAAQSLGSNHGGRQLGTFGDVGSFSFSTPKIISTGQGGALVTSSGDIAQALSLLRDFGRRAAGVDEHVAFGVNLKFTDLQAVVGLEQMKKLPSRLVRKRQIWCRYAARLSRIPGLRLVATDIADVVPWFVDVYTSDRDALRQFLASRQIGTRPLYPAINTQAPYHQGGEFPVAGRASAEGLWLPSSFTLLDDQVDRVCDAIDDFCLSGVRPC